MATWCSAYWPISSDTRRWKFLGGGEAPSTTQLVDLGLPSGLLWADRNLGATELVSVGIYYSWGNIDGHPAGDGYNFSQEVYDETSAAAIEDNLSLNQDAARALLGDSWRMPTATEFQELYDNCTCVWTTLNGMIGMLFTSNVNGNTLFLPAAGYFDGTSLNNRGSSGYYWSSTFVSDANARDLSFNNLEVRPQYSGSRRFGFTIRPVKASV